MSTQIQKPKRGDCGTCHWFDPMLQQAKPALGLPPQPRIGLCLFNPPQPYPVQQQVSGTQFLPQGPQVAPSTVGMTPPTTELRRCSHWRPLGTQPPFDDLIRPFATKGEIQDEIQQ